MNNSYNNSYNTKSNPLNGLFYEIRSRINSQDGNQLANLLSIERFSITNDLRNSIINLQWDKQHFDSSWDDVVKYHLFALQLLISKKNYVGAFGHQCSMMQALHKALTQAKEENWMLPVVYVVSVELRKLAIRADEMAQLNTSKKTVKPDANVEEAASHLMNLFRVCATDSRTKPEFSKRCGMMSIINQLFKIYFRINKLNLYKPLVRALENANIMEEFTLADRVTYSYFTGMKSLYDSDYKKADNLLSFAFENCHSKMYKNRRMILIFLIPVKMLYSGCMPTEEILADYDLRQFKSLCQAIKEGNLYLFDEAIEKNSDFFYYYGIYFTLEKLKTLVYRNIFKKVAQIVNTHQIPLNYFVDAVNYFQSNRNQIQIPEDEMVTTDEVQCLLSILIDDNKLKGYISLQHKKLVISKQNPFPMISIRQKNDL